MNTENTESTEHTESTENTETSPKRVSFPIKILFICIILFAAGWGISQFISTTKKPLTDTSIVTKTIKPLKTTKQSTQAESVEDKTDKQVKKNDTVKPENKSKNLKTDAKIPSDTKTATNVKPNKKEPKKLNFPKKPSKQENKKQASSIEKTATPATAKASATPGFSFAVQVGAFKNEKNARNFALKLSKEGYPDAYVEQFEDRAKTIWNVVRLGQFEKKDAAFKSAAKYYEKNKEKAFVTYADTMMMIMK